ncbi:MAG: ATP-binding protein [Gemmatimonadaceae bacterium]
MDTALLMIEPQLATKRLDSVVDVPPDVFVEADPDRMREILLTLISNAMRYTEHGGHVMVDLGYPDGMPEDVVMIRVGDSGRGIPRDLQDEIFEPSAHAHHPLTGAGPGLAVSREWARHMGGDIRVRSDEGAGSVFTLSLPRG